MAGTCRAVLFGKPINGFPVCPELPKELLQPDKSELQKPIIKETGTHLIKAPGVTGMMMMMMDIL